MPRDVGGLDVKVSEGTLERALQVMAQVVAVLERQGYSVTVSDTSRTIVAINNERVFFGIEEPIRKVVCKKPACPTQRIAGIMMKRSRTNRQASWPLHPLGDALGKTGRAKALEQKSSVSNPASRISWPGSWEPLSLRGVERKSANETRPRKKSANESGHFETEIFSNGHKIFQFVLPPKGALKV